MQEFLEYVVKGLVQKPEAVSITPVERGGMTVYELRMDPGDVGKIIGQSAWRSELSADSTSCDANQPGLSSSKNSAESMSFPRLL